MSETNIIVAGAAGRMGREVMRAVQDTDGVQLAGGFDRPDCPDKGRDLGALIGGDDLGLTLFDAFDAAPAADVAIDFTTPDAAVENAKACAAAGVRLVLGVTGLSEAQQAAIAAAAEKIAIVQSGNMSLGVNLLTALVERAAAALGPDYDIEILDRHHGRKVDAPSGTAFMLGEAAAKGRGVSLTDKSVFVRKGQTGARRSGDIGFAVQRGGGVIGDHTVALLGADEIVEFSHRALDRSLFARGAVAAAKWVADKPSGLYSMGDVLGLS